MADISKKVEKGLEKLEDLVKLKSLETEKKISELDLGVGKLESKFKDVWQYIPDVKERSEEIETLLDVVQLGLMDFKKNVDSLDTRLKKFEGVPKEVETALAGSNKRLQALENNLKNVSDSLNSLLQLKDEIGKDIENKVLPEIKAVKESSDQYKQQIDEIKKDVDNFSTLVKSFQRTLELTDIDREIKRFEAINTKIANIETRLEELKLRIPEASISEKELEIMKNRVHELSEIVVDRESQLKELETAIQMLKIKPPESEKNLKKIEELEKKFEMFSDDIKFLKSRLRSGLEITSRGTSETHRLGLTEIELINTVGQLSENFEELNNKFLGLKAEAELTLRITEKMQQEAKEYTVEGITKYKELDDLKRIVADIQDSILKIREIPKTSLEDIHMKITLLNSRLNEVERKLRDRDSKPIILE